MALSVANNIQSFFLYCLVVGILQIAASFAQRNEVEVEDVVFQGDGERVEVLSAEEHRRSRLLGLDYRKVQQIKCPGYYTTFKSWIAIEFTGQLRPTADDSKDLAALLWDAFKTESALRCDPYQRAIKAAAFIKFQSSPSPQLPFQDDPSLDLALYRVHVLSYGGTPSPYVTALEPEPARFLSLDKNPTGKRCAISDILDYDHIYGCPRFGCYCPAETIRSNAETAGPTEKQLVTSLDSRLEGCQEFGIGGGKGDAYKIRGSCLPKVQEIKSVRELRQVEPCGASRELNSTFLTFLNVDPCSLGDEFLNIFLDELIATYNKVQFELCDPSFRRIGQFELLNFCSTQDRSSSNISGNNTIDNHRRRRLTAQANPRFGYRTGGTTTSEDNNYVEGNRRRLSLNKMEEDESEKRMPSFTPFQRDESEPVLNGSYPEEEKSSQRSLASDWAKDEPLCFCSAFTQGSRSLTGDEFERIANEIMQRLTGGEVRVEEQFEVDEGCPEKRVAIKAGLEVYLNVDVNSLTNEDIDELEESCILAYNNYIVDNCSEQYTQVRSCKISKFVQKRRGKKRRGSFLRFDIRGDSGARIDFFFKEDDDDKPRAHTRRSTRSLSWESNSTDSHTVLSWENQQRELEVATDTTPPTLCFCRRGVGIGRNPTVNEFVEILNATTGIFDFAIEVERKGHKGRGM